MLHGMSNELGVAFYDTRPYDRHFFEQSPTLARLAPRFFEFRLSASTVATAAGCRAVCVFVNDRVDRACLERLKELGVGLVALRCAGFNNVDLDAARSLGIRVTRVPAYSPHAVAEHAVGLLLTLNRKIHRAYNRVREHNFSLNGLVGTDLHGKTVGLVGTGKIGKVAARIFRGFDTRVLAYDPYQDAAWAKSEGVEYVSFETLLSASDIVSLHLPLTPESHHLFNAASFAKLKRGAYLINTSRGKLIDTTALIEALRQGWMAGVGLDVYEEEEGIFFEDHSEHVLPDDELNLLLTFPNVLVTSHQAFLTAEALGEIVRVTVENLSRYENSNAGLPGTILD